MLFETRPVDRDATRLAFLPSTASTKVFSLSSSFHENLTLHSVRCMSLELGPISYVLYGRFCDRPHLRVSMRPSALFSPVIIEPRLDIRYPAGYNCNTPFSIALIFPFIVNSPCPFAPEFDLAASHFHLTFLNRKPLFNGRKNGVARRCICIVLVAHGTSLSSVSRTDVVFREARLRTSLSTWLPR